MSFLNLIQSIFAVLMILSILIQHRASGLSATFGGSGAVPIQRRGAERFVFLLSIWSSVLFFALAVARWYIEGR